MITVFMAVKKCQRMTTDEEEQYIGYKSKGNIAQFNQMPSDEQMGKI